MSVLTWGKPKLEIVAFVDGAMPSEPTWVEVATPVENSTKLTPSAGARREAVEEGGGVIDTKVSKSKYVLEFELFAKGTKPITDADGVIIPNYAIRLTPEDSSLPGYLIDKSSVTVEETWDAENGGKWKYSFSALVPASGNMVKPYTAA